MFCRKATCAPCGAGGLPEVKPLLLAGDAGAAGEGPGRAGGAVLELAGPHLHLLETRVRDRVDVTCRGERDRPAGAVSQIRHSACVNLRRLDRVQVVICILRTAQPFWTPMMSTSRVSGP